MMLNKILILWFWFDVTTKALIWMGGNVPKSNLDFKAKFFLHGSNHWNWIRVDLTIYLDICKKLYFTGIWKLGCFQNLYIFLCFVNSCSLIVYVERKCQQQINLNDVYSQIIDFTRQSFLEKNKNTSTNLHMHQGKLSISISISILL